MASSTGRKESVIKRIQMHSPVYFCTCSLTNNILQLDYCKGNFKPIRPGFIGVLKKLTRKNKLVKSHLVDVSK